MTLTGRSWFSLFITIVMLVMVVIAFEYNPKARLIPIMVGTLIFIMALIQFLGDTFPAIADRLPFLRQKGLLTADQTHSEVDSKDESMQEKAQPHQEEKEPWSRILISFIWLIGFTVILYLTTYLVAVPLFLFFFVRFAGKAKTLPSLLLSIGMSIFMYVLFELLLNARF
jgi:small-conductance mechanosensitive channel